VDALDAARGGHIATWPTVQGCHRQQGDDCVNRAASVTRRREGENDAGSRERASEEETYADQGKTEGAGALFCFTHWMTATNLGDFDSDQRTASQASFRSVHQQL
jgi:hypothetical protein